MGPNFHASEASGSEEENFNIFLSISMVQNPGHPGENPCWTLGPLFEQIIFRSRRQGYIPNFKQLSLAILVKTIFSTFYLQTKNPLG